MLPLSQEVVAACDSAGDCTYTAAVARACTAISDDVACASADISGDEATSQSNCETAGDCNYRASVVESCDGTDDLVACSNADLSTDVFALDSGDNARRSASQSIALH